MLLQKRQFFNNALSGYGGYGFPSGAYSSSSNGYSTQNYRNAATTYSPFGVSNSFNAGSSATGYSNNYMGYYAKDADAKKPTNILAKGAEVGAFSFESTIILVFKAPKQFQFSVKEGEPVRVGQVISNI
ncbi:hypothetical protein PtB15_4B645 [Puccinia triticina]|nr:hypothetical protein PtB15_4B645 [Puccinia triticina]